jgi:hypothetical protein
MMWDVRCARQGTRVTQTLYPGPYPPVAAVALPWARRPCFFTLDPPRVLSRKPRWSGGGLGGVGSWRCVCLPPQHSLCRGCVCRCVHAAVQCACAVRVCSARVQRACLQCSALMVPLAWHLHLLQAVPQSPRQGGWGTVALVLPHTRTGDPPVGLHPYTRPPLATHTHHPPPLPPRPPLTFATGGWGWWGHGWGGC